MRTLQARDYYMPRSAAECFAVLTAPAVYMRITVQHIAFLAARGLVKIRLSEQGA